jgi:hypothetical protein
LVAVDQLWAYVAAVLGFLEVAGTPITSAHAHQHRSRSVFWADKAENRSQLIF